MISPCVLSAKASAISACCARFVLHLAWPLHQFLPFIRIQHKPYTLGNAAVGCNTFLAVLIERLLHWQAPPKRGATKGLAGHVHLEGWAFRIEGGHRTGMERLWNGYGTRYGTKSPIFCQVKKTLTGSICRRSAYRQANGGKRSQQSSSSLETSHQSSSPLTDPTAVTPI